MTTDPMPVPAVVLLLAFIALVPDTYQCSRCGDWFPAPTPPNPPYRCGNC